MFPSESLDLPSWSWLLVCQGAWEHTFRNTFQSIWSRCGFYVFILVTNAPKQYYRLTPPVTNTQIRSVYFDCLGRFLVNWRNKSYFFGYIAARMFFSCTILLQVYDEYPYNHCGFDLETGCFKEISMMMSQYV